MLTQSGLRSLILPAITLSLFQLTLIMRLVRAEMLEVLRTDYIRFARARGLSQRAINFGHALKNTMVPVITITGLQLGSVIAFYSLSDPASSRSSSSGSSALRAIASSESPSARFIRRTPLVCRPALRTCLANVRITPPLDVMA